METIQNNIQQNEYFSRRKEKEQKLRAEQSKRRSRMLLKWVIVFIITFLVVLGLYKLAARPAAPASGAFFKAQSRDHIQPDALHADYNSNPPTGGWHNAQTVQSGIYAKELSDEQVIHNLEHGHIWIAYKPDLPKGQVDALAKIALDYGSKIVMAPRTANDTPIALVAWQRLLKLDAADELQIKTFIDAYRGRGPENVSDSGFKDFR